MVIGAVSCPLEKTRKISDRIREIKTHHNLKKTFEVKWTKVSPAKVSFYKELIDYFFDNNDLQFRALIIPDKTKLAHEKFGQDHNTWYYKMYFDMLKVVFEPDGRYRIYLDIKDTCGAEKVAKLHDVLCNNIYDFSKKVIERIQLVRSDEIEILQLTDLLIGAISYINRGLSNNSAKATLVYRMKDRSGYSLTKSTLLREKKVNLFVWHAI